MKNQRNMIYSSNYGTYSYKRGTSWLSGDIHYIDSDYTGEVETEFIPDLLLCKQVLVHITAYMFVGRIFTVKSIGIQLGSIGFEVPRLLSNILLHFAPTLEWRPYGQFI